MSPLKYSLVIFDSDGTLADTLPFLRVLFNQLADKHRFRKVEAEEVEQFRHMNGRDVFAALGIPLWKVPLIVNDMRRLMAKNIGQFSVFPGVDDMLRRLSAANMTLAVVSSNSTENVRAILGVDTAGLIAHYACGASVFGKASKLLSVLRKTNVPAEQAIYIGDEIRDAEAAAKAKVAFGAVGWGQHDLASLQRAGATEMFRTVSDIAGKLLDHP